jgi:hypothetical protein
MARAAASSEGPRQKSPDDSDGPGMTDADGSAAAWHGRVEVVRALLAVGAAMDTVDV